MISPQETFDKNVQYAQQIQSWRSHQDFADISAKELPHFLINNPLLNSLADTTNTVVQIYDMKGFRPIYASPNCINVSGFTPEELNSKGFLFWLSTVPMKEILFFIKSSKFVNDQLRKPSSNSTFFSNQVINMSYKNKQGEARKMVSTNRCLEFTPEGKQRFQLIIWQDMTHRSKSDDIVGLYKFNEDQFFSYEPMSGKFTHSEFLSPREKEIIHNTKNGLTSKELSDHLCLSQHTIDNHKKNIMNKFQVKTMGDVIEVGGFIGLI
jgi:DNA-binding CsgD family transcriptional regulator